MPNISPWIHQLDKDRKHETLRKDAETDVAIVGAGMAGISTAFFLLRETDKKVIILESYKLAHGATGHNAGQITSYFERPFRELVEEFGLELASHGEKAIKGAWSLLDDIYTTAGLDINLFRFTGFAGLSTREQVFNHLEDNYWRRKAGIQTERVFISEEAEFLPAIPEKYHGLFSLTTRAEIGLRLETFDPQYIAILSSQKGVMNSALFCQEVARYLLEEYKDRFSLYEHTPVSKVVLKEKGAILDAGKCSVKAGSVVLCTNGFETFNIISPEGLSINTRFHLNLSGVVAFMSGYLEKHSGVPSVASYFPQGREGLTDNQGEPYFYVTRRPYEYNEGKHDLVSVGGPDFALEESAQYDRGLEFSEDALKQITSFVNRTYDKKDGLEFKFLWHGVMGYTKNMVRMVGRDPGHSCLLYNLGCNGVGILPSVWGGDRIARIIAGEQLEPSIFDPKL